MQWISVDTPPTSSDVVLTNGGDGYSMPVICSGVFENGEWFPDTFDAPRGEFKPTHWALLSPPPAD